MFEKFNYLPSVTRYKPLGTLHNFRTLNYPVIHTQHDGANLKKHHRIGDIGGIDSNVITSKLGLYAAKGTVAISLCTFELAL